MLTITLCCRADSIKMRGTRRQSSQLQLQVMVREARNLPDSPISRASSMVGPAAGATGAFVLLYLTSSVCDEGPEAGGSHWRTKTQVQPLTLS